MVEVDSSLVEAAVVLLVLSLEVEVVEEVEVVQLEVGVVVEEAAVVGVAAHPKGD